MPVLEVTDQRAAVLLRAKSAKTTMVTLFGVVSPYRRRGASTLVHVMEAIGDRVVGGSSIQISV